MKSLVREVTSVYPGSMKSILVLTIAFLTFPCISFSALANEEKNSNSSSSGQTPKTEETEERPQEKPFDFSSTGRPGQQTAGESRGSCDLDQSLQAIIPTSHAGKTVLGHPKFWVYIANVSNQIDRLEFVLQNEAREDVWRAQMPLDAKSSTIKVNHVEPSGYKNFSLPSTEPPLKTGQWYRWYVKAYCKSQVASSHYVQGWINRIPVNSPLHVDLKQEDRQPHEVYGRHGVWYDAVNHLLQSYRYNPRNLDFEADWQLLLEAGGLCSNQLPAVTTTYEVEQY